MIEKKSESKLENIFISFFMALIGKNKIGEFSEKLFLNGKKINSFGKFVKFGLATGGVSCIVSMLALFYLGFSEDKFLICAGIIFFAPFFLAYLYTDVLFERKKRVREELLPEVLLEVSVFCDEKSLLKTIEKISEMDFGLISFDFKRVVIEINNGSSVQDALMHLKQLNKSKNYDRAIDLLLQGYSTGAELSVLLTEMAEEMLENKSIIRERQAVMLVTKYTLLLAAGLIVPAILGLIIGLVSGFGFSGMGEIGLGLTESERTALFSAAVSGINIYIIEYAIIGSFFLALQDGSKKQFWVYALFLTPVALIAFFLAQAL